MEQAFFHSDMELFIDNRVDWERLLQLRDGPDVSAAEEVETFRMIMRTAGEVCADIEQDALGHWHEAVDLVDGEVKVPEHVKKSYSRLREAGLTCLPLKPKYNGSNVPMLLNVFFLEMLSRANSSLMTIVGLQTGVAQDIEKYGTDELRDRYLPRFAAGELQGAMDLTEAQAGSDLGGIVTRCDRKGDAYIVNGEKIFITNGGAEIHLVLARDGDSYDESKGTTNGLNLLLCPVTTADGKPNGVTVTRVEHKLGIHGSPTCVVNFEDAEAYLLGKVGEGFRAMLDLMNNARLGVAAQAIGIAEAAYRAAREYAAQRTQFGIPILQQPMVKSMLGGMAINIQAARALLYRTCAMIDTINALDTYLASDRSADDPDRAAREAERDRLQSLLRFFTPLCKYYSTEIADDVTRAGIQVHGGIGYMAETSAGQYHNDSIITTIYEGTSEIQASFALKEMAKGALVTTLEQTKEQLEPLRGQFGDLVERVCEGVDAINGSIAALLTDFDYALLNAKRISQMVIDVVVSAELLLQAADTEEKSTLARVYINRHILSVEMNAKRISSGDASRIKRYNTILGLD